jgi:hypothetical protein
VERSPSVNDEAARPSRQWGASSAAQQQSSTSAGGLAWTVRCLREEQIAGVRGRDGGVERRAGIETAVTSDGASLFFSNQYHVHQPPDLDSPHSLCQTHV